MIGYISHKEWSRFAKTVAVVGGAAWIFWKFILQGEYQHRIALSVDIRFSGRHREHWVAEVVANIENKGLVGLIIRELHFEVRRLDRNDAVSEGDPEINRQLFFPHKIKAGSWLSPNWKFTFVRAGITNSYTLVTSIPKDYEFLLVHGRFDYGSRSFHTADKVIRVPDWAEGTERS